MIFALKPIMKLLKVILFFVFSINAYAQLEYPFYAQSTASFKDGKWENANKLQILNSGIASLAKRIQMVREAKSSIDIEYFIWELDLSGRILLTELVKRARDGVKVRIIIDKSFTVLELDEYYAEELKRLGIEIRYYNASLGPLAQQYRTHRKILVTDKKQAITGGRNIGDDYFDLDEEYNFLDRDIWIDGSGAKAMGDSFDAVWESGMVQIARMPDPRQIHDNHATAAARRPDLRMRVHRRRQREARDFLQTDRDLERRRHDIYAFGMKVLRDVHAPIDCPKFTFVSDKPDKGLGVDYFEQSRMVHQVLMSRLARVEKSFTIVSPYFMLNDKTSAEFDRLLQEGKTITAYTNSLGSTDAFYVAANFYRIAPDWSEKGMNIWMHNSKFYPETEVLSSKISKARWGVHSKTQIYDDEDFFIGTYNLDNRSDFFNLEMGIFCEGSPELTAILKSNIDQRMKEAYRIIKKEEAVDANNDSADYWGHASESHLKIMNAIKLPSKWFEFLM